MINAFIYDNSKLSTFEIENSAILEPSLGKIVWLDIINPSQDDDRLSLIHI